MQLRVISLTQDKNNRKEKKKMKKVPFRFINTKNILEQNYKMKN